MDVAPPSVSAPSVTIAAESSVLVSESMTAAELVTSRAFSPSVAVPAMSAPDSTVSVAPVTVTLPCRSIPWANVARPRSMARSASTAPTKRTLPCSVLCTEIGVAERFVTAFCIS